MSAFTCPNGCGPLSVYLARRGRRSRPYLGCRNCGASDWRGGSPLTDVACADAFDVAGTRREAADEPVDSVLGLDPYA